MSPAQVALYWREWSACQAVRKARGLSVGDTARHALTAEALGGAEKSMKVLRNHELDRVLAKFRSFSRPDDLGAQLAAEELPEQRCERYLTAAHEALEELAQLDQDKRRFADADARSAYLEGIARKVIGVSIAACTEAQMRRILGIVARHHARAKSRQRAAEKSAAISAQLEGENPF